MRSRAGLSTTVMASAVAGLLIGLAYATAGGFLMRRARRSGQLALRLFAAFWLGVGAYAVAEGAWALSYAAGARSFGVALAVLQVKILSVSAGFGGLVAYLAYLYTGRRRAVGMALAYYVAVYAMLQAHYAYRQPVAQGEGLWGMRLEYAHASVEPWWTLALAMLLVPPIVAAVAYASLLRVAREPALRRRIMLTSFSLLLFLTPTLLAWRAGGAWWWGPTEKALGALAALGMLGALRAAYKDGARATGEGLAHAMETRRFARDAALRERARELV